MRRIDSAGRPHYHRRKILGRPEAHRSVGGSELTFTVRAASEGRSVMAMLPPQVFRQRRVRRVGRSSFEFEALYAPTIYGHRTNQVCKRTATLSISEQAVCLSPRLFFPVNCRRKWKCLVGPHPRFGTRRHRNVVAQGIKLYAFATWKWAIAFATYAYATLQRADIANRCLERRARAA